MLTLTSASVRMQRSIDCRSGLKSTASCLRMAAAEVMGISRSKSIAKAPHRRLAMPSCAS